ncbi:MAG: DUF6677 family protein [Vicinamibacterales bacterium]
MRASTVDRAQTIPPLAASAVAWAIPGAGHLLLGRRQKGLIFLVALTTMFAVGLGLSGRLFPFAGGEPLVLLAALASRGMGLLALAAGWMGAGQGVVTAASYEYGNAFLVVSGLLNSLVALDAYDVAAGRK